MFLESMFLESVFLYAFLHAIRCIDDSIPRDHTGPNNHDPIVIRIYGDYRNIRNVPIRRVDDPYPFEAYTDRNINDIPELHEENDAEQQKYYWKCIKRENAIRKFILSCPICLKQFTTESRRPCVGLCGHTMCEEHISNPSDNKKSCPVCSVNNLFSRNIINESVMDLLNNPGTDYKTLLKCKKCSEQLSSSVSEKRPVIGRCGHTLCMGCAYSLPECPYCKMKHSFDDKVVNQFIMNVQSLLNPAMETLISFPDEWDIDNLDAATCTDCGETVSEIALCKKCSNASCEDPNDHTGSGRIGFKQLTDAMKRMCCAGCAKKRHSSADEDLVVISKDEMRNRYFSKLLEINKICVNLIFDRKINKILYGLKKIHEEDALNQMNGKAPSAEFENKIAECEKMGDSLFKVLEALKSLLGDKERSVWDILLEFENNLTEVVLERNLLCFPE